jgi:hypothetical protein
VNYITPRLPDLRPRISWLDNWNVEKLRWESIGENEDDFYRDIRIVIAQLTDTLAELRLIKALFLENLECSSPFLRAPR